MWRIWGWQMQTITFRMGKQRGPTVQHKEICPVFWVRTRWKIGGLKKEYKQIDINIYTYIFAIQQKLEEHYKSALNLKKIKKGKKMIVWVLWPSTELIEVLTENQRNMTMSGRKRKLQMSTTAL